MKINGTIKDLWCLEYSLSQKCFHVYTLGEAVENNLKNMDIGITTDYMIIAVSKEFKEIRDYCETLKQARKVI